MMTLSCKLALRDPALNNPTEETLGQNTETTLFYTYDTALFHISHIAELLAL